MYVDDFKLSGPKENIEQGWRFLQEASEGCPMGVEIDPPTNVGRYLGCEHHLSTQCVEWHGELPTVLDPPPPKVKKAPTFGQTVESDDEESGGDSAAQPTEPYQPRQPKMVRAIEYDMTEFFEYCATLCTTNRCRPCYIPCCWYPYGQGGPRGEKHSPAAKAIAAALGIQADTGSPDRPVEVPGLAAEGGPDDPEAPT
eukprot:2563316-Pyramimonas_sp.AAC.1